MKKKNFALILILLLFSGSAAQQMKGQKNGYKNGMSICKEDRQKFCSKERGHANIHACMDKHISELSADCQNFHNNMSNDMKGKAHEACLKDIETYCSDIQPGQGRMRDCLKANKEKISTECKKYHSY
jgi:Skp family chaperone for outer membrane proteins